MLFIANQDLSDVLLCSSLQAVFVTVIAKWRQLMKNFHYWSIYKS